MLKKLSEYLWRTRTPFTQACKFLGIDPEWTDPSLLSVRMCDNCGYWDKPKNMIKDPDDSIYCKACEDANYVRIK